jgi:hypothetical protein
MPELFPQDVTAPDTSLNDDTPRGEGIAEVIASSTGSFTAEVYRGKEAPAFGSWVRVRHENGTEIFGLVSRVEIGSVDPHRRAIAMGRTPEELRLEMPHVLELIRSTITAQTVAYRDRDGRMRQTLPPSPPSLHSFVIPCSHADVCALGQPYDYLRTLARNPDPTVPADDLLVAVLRQIFEANEPKAEGSKPSSKPAAS